MLLASLLAPDSAHAQLPAGTWQYSWGDDFSGTAVDTGKWDVASPGWTMPNSLSVASADKVRIENGALVLDATRTATSGTTQFSSGSVSTYTKPKFTGSYIEARIWLPDTPGSWPAFWGLYTGWPPEMDIMEYPIDTAAGTGYAQDQYHTAFHYTNTSGTAAAGAGQVNPGSAGDLGGAWHIFGANWVQNSSVTFYFDGAQVSSFSNATEVAEMANMYLILDYAVGGWPGEPNTTEWPLGFTDHTKVDWVRVWKSAAASTTNWTNASGLSTDWQVWETGGNWSNGSPNLGGVTANFGTLGSLSERRIDIVGGGNGNRTLSTINFDGSTRYLIGWPTDRMVLGFGNGGAIQPTINVAATTTTDHELWTGLEWSGNLIINNSSTHPLLLTGPVIGGDGINISGPGAVSFDSSNNTYSGWTSLDPAGTGPGIARARGKNSLGSGLLRIGPVGNATTARLELENDALVSNPITLNGRNNSSAGILNNSGNNTISGTISSDIGGANFWIQSDTGHLELSGTNGGGTAIRSNATGTRTFTLKGAGAGTVSGSIGNGNATVNLVKDGPGTWTLDRTNTYTGTTTLTGGTLEVNGTTGSGATAMASGTTLAGGGTVHGNLTAPAGSTIRAGAVGFTLVPASPFTLLDNFDSYDNSTNTLTTAATGGVWSAEFVGTNNSHVVDSDQGQSLQTSGGAAWRGAERDLTGTDAAILVGETQTYFWQVKATSTGGAYDFMMGLSQSVANIDSVNAYQDFNVMPFINNGATTPYINADAPTTPWWAPMNTNAWYNVWVVVNNDAAAPTYDLYYSQGAAAPVLVAANANWRNTGPLPVGNTLNAIGFMAAGGAGSTLLIDNIHYAPGEELQNPMDFIGAPPVSTAGTLNVGGTLNLNAGATVEFDVSTGTLHDKLVVGGQFNANGTLKVTLDPAQAAPVLGDSFDLFDSAGGTINFAGYDLPPLSNGLTWNTASIGTGVLSVVAEPNTYAGWVLGQTFAPGTDGPATDIEKDGIANAFEWLFGSNPQVSDTGALPQPVARSVSAAEYSGADPAKHYLTMTATVRKIHTGMTLTPQANSSLELLDSPASAGLVTSFPVNDLGDFEKRTWIYTEAIEDTPGGRGFMRLKLISE